MKTQVILSEPLADPCHHTCRRCVRTAGTPPLVAARSCSTSLKMDRSRRPESAGSACRSPRCERCEFLLLMLAIEYLIPAEELPDWLKQPNVDLGGLCPAECIESGVYEPIFTALFRLDPCGPVS